MALLVCILSKDNGCKDSFSFLLHDKDTLGQEKKKKKKHTEEDCVILKNDEGHNGNENNRGTKWKSSFKVKKYKWSLTHFLPQFSGIPDHRMDVKTSHVLRSVKKWTN